MSDPIQPLSYADHRNDLEPKASHSLRIAIVCGTVPLAIGVLILNCFLVTEWVGLIFAGLLTLFGGLIAFTAGSTALLVYLREMRANGGLEPRIKLRIILVALLLLSNFPAAIACIWIGGDRIAPAFP